MRRPIRLIVVAALAGQYGRDVVRGIQRYCATHGRWEHHLEVTTDSPALARTRIALEGWKPDGMIVHADNPPMDRLVRSCGIPVVNTSGALPPSVATVIADNVAVGRMVAEYFLAQGRRSLAFNGLPRHFFYASERAEGFLNAAAAAGCPRQVFGDSPGPWLMDWPERARAMQRWLAELPMPVGMFCDSGSLDVLRLCQRRGYRVPEDVAVVTVDNDDLICQMFNPPLSSVLVPAERIGMEAAALVHRMIRGQPPPKAPLRVPPVDVLVRRSSEAAPCPDPDVEAALAFIRAHADRPLKTADILAEVPLSRRSLERKFAHWLRRSPKQEILKAHLDRARRLLVETDLPVWKVALQSGLVNASMMGLAFRKALGTTPGRYRGVYGLPGRRSAADVPKEKR